LWVKLRSDAAPHREAGESLKKMLKALLALWPIVLFVLIIWGGIFSGKTTVAESAGLAAFIAFITMLICKKREFLFPSI